MKVLSTIQQILDKSRKLYLSATVQYTSIVQKHYIFLMSNYIYKLTVVMATICTTRPPAVSLLYKYNFVLACKGQPFVWGLLPQTPPLWHV